jgi:hypothetical protein
MAGQSAAGSGGGWLLLLSGVRRRSRLGDCNFRLSFRLCKRQLLNPVD